MKKFEYYLEAIKLSSASPQTLKEIDEIKNKMSSLLNILKIGNKYYNDEKYDTDNYSFDPKELEEFIKDIKSKISLINKELSDKVEEEKLKINTYQYNKKQKVKNTIPGKKDLSDRAYNEKFKEFYIKRAQLKKLHFDVFRDFANYILNPRNNHIKFEHTPAAIKSLTFDLLKNENVQESLLKYLHFESSEKLSDKELWNNFLNEYFSKIFNEEQITQLVNSIK